MKLTTVIEELSKPDTKATTVSLRKVETGYEILPQDFYLQAEKDLQEGNEINCLTNSKRALDAQVNSLLVAFGYNNKTKKSFPDKIELINKIGIIAPRILLKINSVRNLLEHKFKKPTKEQTEDFLDITALFLAGTDRYINNFPESASFGNKDRDFHLNIYIHYKTSQIEIKESRNNFETSYLNIAKYYLGSIERENKFADDKKLNAQTIIIDIRNEEYIPVLRQYLRLAVLL